MFIEKQIKKLSKESGDFRIRCYPDKFTNCEREFMKGLDQDVVLHAFNPSSWETKASQSLSSRADWFTEQDS